MAVDPETTSNLFDWFWKGALGLGGSVVGGKLVWQALQKLTSMNSLVVAESGTREDVVISLNRQVEGLYAQLDALTTKLKGLQADMDDDVKKRRVLEQTNFEQMMRIAQLENQIKDLGHEPVDQKGRPV